MGELIEAINSMRDPKLVKAEQEKELMAKEQNRRDFESVAKPIFNMMFRDPILAEEVGKQVAKEDRRSKKMLEGENSNKTPSIENKDAKTELRSSNPDMRTKQLMGKADELSASVDGEQLSIE